MWTLSRLRSQPVRQGSPNRWEPDRFGWFSVDLVRLGTRTGPVPTHKPCLHFFLLQQTGRFHRFTGLFFWTEGNWFGGGLGNLLSGICSASYTIGLVVLLYLWTYRSTMYMPLYNFPLNGTYLLLQPVRLTGGWWLVLVCSERKVLLTDCWWLVCSKRKSQGRRGIHSLKCH
jgi:hypothetical protein